MDWLNFSPWAGPALAAIAALLLALLVHRIGLLALRRLGRHTVIVKAVVERCNRPSLLVLPLFATQLALQGVPDGLAPIEAVRHVNGVLLIAALTWLAIAVVQGAADGWIARHPSNVADNLHARRIETQTRVLSRVVMGLLFFAGVAFLLMTFPRARQLGASLLASAGVAGLVAGIAARSVFSNLIAGLQIALTQPLRIDDVLIVEGEWGRVEDITGTYVVMKLWDERRQIVPLQWFIEHPFQNWTHTSAQLLGTVFLWVDYRLPLAPLRAEAQYLCKASKNWDGRVCGIQVTDVNERSMQLRVLASSASSGQNFDLRCELREGLLDFIQRKFPEGLPVTRAEIGGELRGPLDQPLPDGAARPAMQ